MFCRYCGSQIENNSKFCPNCGAQLEQEQQTQSSGSWEQQAEQQRRENWENYQREHQQYNQYNQYNNQNQYQQGYYQPPLNQQQDMPMKWFKFIIYFQLFANMVLNFVSAISAFTGSMYGEGIAAKIVYAAYPGLKTVDIVYGIICILLVLLAFVARQRLAKFKKNGPSTYILCQTANLAAAVLYVILVATVGKVDTQDLNLSSQITSIVLSIAMIVINKIYFDKRKHLFIND